MVLTDQLLKLKTQGQIHVLFGYFLGINIFMTPFVDDLKDPQCIFFQPEVKKVFLVSLPASSFPIPQPYGLPTSNW